MPTQPHIFDLTPDSLGRLVAQFGWPAFRARQILEWVYKKNVVDPQQMTNLSKHDRDTLAANIRFIDSQTLSHQTATDGVQKLLVQWSDPALADKPPVAPEPDTTRQTECVMIPASDNRRTACISSQVGCPVKCTFCASGLGGLDANLTAGQIIEQVWLLNQLPGVARISNVVFMGMGEPLANFDAVTHAVQTLIADWAFNISGRSITISTVGLPAQIRRLAELKLPVTLAISLHAPNDELRKQLIPWAQYVSIEQLLQAGRDYFTATGREITLEYILLGGVNDQPQHANQLAAVARQLRSNINLIRFNEVAPLPFKRPDSEDVHNFQAILLNRGVNTHIRASRGRDIAAACGQLRHEHKT